MGLECCRLSRHKEKAGASVRTGRSGSPSELEKSPESAAAGVLACGEQQMVEMPDGIDDRTESPVIRTVC